MSALTDLFTNIANAIRAKTGSQETIQASDFPDAILSIPYTPPTPVSTLTITRQGTLRIAVANIFNELDKLTQAQKQEELEIEQSDPVISFLFGYAYDPQETGQTYSFGIVLDTEYNEAVLYNGNNDIEVHSRYNSLPVLSETFHNPPIVQDLVDLFYYYMAGDSTRTISVTCDNSNFDGATIELGKLHINLKNAPDLEIDMGDTPYIWVGED